MTFFLDLIAILYFILLVPVPVFWVVFHGWQPLWRHFGYGAYLLALAGYMGVMSWTLLSLSTFVAYRIAPDASWMWAGLALIVFGFAVEVRAAADLSLGTMIGMPQIIQSHGKKALVTEGLYAYSRHPLYLAYMVMALGFAVATGLAALWFLFFWLVAGLTWVAMVEEKELEERFGEQYKKYAKKTAIFVPRIW